ncbi:MAG: MgtC/SapB family protein [Gaiellaceae bacterium]
MPDLSWIEVLVRVALAGALGGAIGLERELRERGAGLRTHMLVAVGSALFTIVSAYGWRDFHFSTASGVVFDPTRIAAQIVTGIGFLGAGAIIRQGLSVRGLTTAATLWAVAAIGLAAGSGYYSAAVITTIVVLVALWPLRIAAQNLLARFHPAHGQLIVELRAGETGVPLLEVLEEAGAHPTQLEFEEEGGRRRVAVELELRPGASSAALVARLMEREEIVGAEWTE